jgi:hypothetical protein
LVAFVELSISGGQARYLKSVRDAIAEIGTKFYRSDDNGVSWTLISSNDLDDGIPFVHDGAIYYLCNRPGRHDIIIIRSDDEGETWTDPVTLFEGRFWGTSAGFAVRDGRLYCSFGQANEDGVFNNRGSRIVALAADLAHDPMDPGAWRISNSLVYPGTPRLLVAAFYLDYDDPPEDARGDHWLEPSVADVNGTLRVIVRNRIDRYATSHVAAVLEIDDDGTDLGLRFVQFHPMPGAQNDFQIIKDPETGYFWTPVNLPSRSQDSDWHEELKAAGFKSEPGNERRILALLYSVDCLNWFQACIVAMWTRSTQGFQYATPFIDGDDMLFAIRTAEAGGNQHDNDLVTFHRLLGFRDLAIDLTKRV